MTCQRVASENLIERYIEGTLDSPLLDEFEDHYFACELCLAQLKTVQAIKPVLATLPPPSRGKLPWAHLPWIGVAAAATVGILLFTWPKQSSSPAAVADSPSAAPAAAVALLQLSEIQPAPYSPTLFRDGDGSSGPAFEAAMRLYQNRQWVQAAPLLAAVAQASPVDPAALHFAGISHLLAGQTEAALAALERVIALGPKSPFEEEARFYRAQALLLSGRLLEARQELERVVQGRGDYEAPARSLLNRF